MWPICFIAHLTSLSSTCEYLDLFYLTMFKKDLPKYIDPLTRSLELSLSSNDISKLNKSLGFSERYHDGEIFNHQLFMWDNKSM